MKSMSDKTLSPKARYKDANKRKPTIFVSIHHNARHFLWKKGETVLYPGKRHTRDSSRLARLVNDNVCGKSGFKKRKLIKSWDIAVLNGTKMPAILTETGYMSNPSDMKRIINKKNQISDGIVKGIKDYFDIKFKAR